MTTFRPLPGGRFHPRQLRPMPSLAARGRARRPSTRTALARRPRRPPRPACAARATLIRSCRLASSSSGSTSTARWARIGPVSTPSSTRCSVQPVTVTPCASASRTACAPGNAGSSAGCVLSTRPPCRAEEGRAEDPHEARRTPPRPGPPRRPRGPAPHPTRPGRRSRAGRTTTVATPAARATSSPPASGRSLITATTRRRVVRARPARRAGPPGWNRPPRRARRRVPGAAQ